MAWDLTRIVLGTPSVRQVNVTGFTVVGSQQVNVTWLLWVANPAHAVMIQNTLTAQVNNPNSAFWYSTDCLQYGLSTALPGSAIQFAPTLLVSQRCPDDRWFESGTCPTPYSDVFDYLTGSAAVQLPTTPTSPPLGGAPVTVSRVTVKFTIDANTVLSSDSARANFTASLASQIGVSLGTKADRIQITSLAAGSLVVGFNILPDPTGQSLSTPTELANAFLFQFNNSHSLLRTQPLMANVDTSFTPQTVDVQMMHCPDGTMQATCPASPGPASGPNIVAIVVPIVVVVLLIICGVGAWWWKRTKDQLIASSAVAPAPAASGEAELAGQSSNTASSGVVSQPFMRVDVQVVKS